MSQPECIINDCTKPRRQRGMCSMHYRRWHLYGDASTVTRTPPHPGRLCGATGCQRPHEASGYCGLHYKRFKKYGTTELPSRPQRICSECPKPAKARGYCEMHYERWSKYGDPSNDGHRPLAERLVTRLARRESGCLEWTGATLKGYGQVGDGQKVLYAHRVAYELAYGPIPDGLHVLHRCDNPPCCEPSHLFVGTHAENMTDMADKGRAHWQTGRTAGAAKPAAGSGAA